MQFSEDNGISAAGMEMLSKGEWRKLTTINLSKNKIGNLGMKYLSESIWTCLSDLKLSKYAII